MPISKQFGSQGELFGVHEVRNPYERLDPADIHNLNIAGSDAVQTGTPPKNYYKQTNETQGVLPGMEMTPEEHVEALGKHHGLEGTFGGGNYLHWIDMHKPYETEHDRSNQVGSLSWRKKGTTTGGEHLEPGEIGLVESDKRGLASDLLRVSETISKENPDISEPKHSTNRSTAGIGWSQAKMKERGQQIW